MKNRILFALSATLYVPLIILLGLEAVANNQRLDGKLEFISDQVQYQLLAVNFAHGHGFTDAILEPVETYNFALDITDPVALEALSTEHQKMTAGARRDFYRAPGFPIMLGATYAIGGNTMLTAEVLRITMIGAIAYLLLVSGALWGGLRGTIIGGIVGLLYLTPEMIRPWSAERVMTEVPTTFLVTLFTLFMVIYGRNRKTWVMVVIGLTFAAMMLTRANFLTALPMLIGYFWLRFVPHKQIAIFTVCAVVPIALWSVYASSHVGKIVSLTTQGEFAFPQFNNDGVLNGAPGAPWTMGMWNPSSNIDPQTGIASFWDYAPQEGENGWVKGFTYWRDNLQELPRLFSNKIYVGFWVRPPFSWFYWFGMGFILLTFIRRRHPRWMTSSPAWFLVFILSHLITTLMFAGVRYHEPLDPVLLLISGFGIWALLERVFVRRHAAEVKSSALPVR